MDWSKFVWDVDNDGDTSNDFAFTAASFVAYDDNGTAADASDDTGGAIINGNVLEATLKTAQLDLLKAKDGFGRDGYDADRTDVTESANAPDVIEISSGFFVDDAGNTSTYSKTDQTITYSDVAGPTITSFGTAQVDTDGSPKLLNGNPVAQLTGSYSFNAGDSMYIFANLSEEVLGGSAITVDLSTGSSVLLTAEENQDYLVGLYTISANDSGLLGPLDVTAMSLTAADASVDEILDFYNNQLTDFALPATNISDVTQITVDNIPIAAASATITQAGADDGAIDEADIVSLLVSETVANTTDVQGQIAALFGSAATYQWAQTNSANDTLNVTLGADEGLDDGDTITLTGVEDAAGNSSDLNFTLEIA